MIGGTLKHYKIEALLGRGGMGEVYKARDVRLDRPVALKVISPDLTTDPERKARFLREARAAAAVSHPAIAQVYDIDEAEGGTFIAMEFVDGLTVRQLVAGGELDLAAAVEIALQVAEGLAKAHDARVLHRDIKSDNIMVTRDGHAKLLDFGLAKLMEEGEGGAPGGGPLLSRTMTRDALRTMPGTVMGTLDYMSPEQARGKALDTRSDIFSLGVVLYEMVAGVRPFRGETPIDTMHAIVYEEAAPVTTLRRNLPPAVHRIVARCLRKKPDDRYPDAHALVEDLRRLKTELDTGTSLVLPAGERFRGWVERTAAAFPLGRAGGALLAGAVALVVLFLVIRIPWGNIFPVVIVGLLGYRFVRNRKLRLLSKVAAKVSRMPGVKAVLERGDRIVVVADAPQASLFLKVGAQVDQLNRRLYFSRHFQAEVKTEVPEPDFQVLLAQGRVLFVRDDVMVRPSSPTSGTMIR